MIDAWLLQAIGLFATAAGALLLLLYLVSAPRFEHEFRTNEARTAYLRRHRRLVIAVALLALWVVVQDVAFIAS